MDRGKDRHIVCCMVYTNPYAYKKLEIRFEIARKVYNKFLGECELRRRAYMNCAQYAAAIDLYKQDKVKNKKEIDKLFKEAAIASGWYLRNAKQHGYTDGIESFAGTLTNTYFAQHLDSGCRNKLAERAFNTSKLCIFGSRVKNRKTGKYERPKVHFNKFGRDHITSLEGKCATSPLRLIKRDGLYCVKWLDVMLPLIVKKDDVKLQHALADTNKITYIRLKRKIVKNKWLYAVDLVCEGLPLKKDRHILGVGVVGMDVGPSSIAFVTNKSAELINLADSISNTKAYSLIRNERLLGRKIDRQRRAGNPDNYNEDGTVKKGATKWRTSKRQKRSERKLADIRRRLAEIRRCYFGLLTNRIRQYGDVVRLDNDSYKGWQRGGYGRSIAKFAPGMFVELLEAKFKQTGGQVVKLNTKKTKSSQTCPGCGLVKKKGNGKVDSRSVRIHECEQCGFVCQRDLTSAICNKFTHGDIVDVDKSKRFVKDKEPILRTCIERLLQSAREGQSLPSTFGKLSELERIVRN